MARWFRLYEKKRGSRRTGSQSFGRLVAAIFSATAFFGGLGFLSLIVATLILPEWRVNRTFVETTCTVIDKRLAQRELNESPVYRAEVLVHYEVGDVLHRLWTYDIARAFTPDDQAERENLAHFEIGARYPCWYDPHAPSTAVLVRGYTWSNWLIMLVPASFIIVGGTGLAYVLVSAGKSAERRAADHQRPRVAATFSHNGSALNPHPHVPQPGTLLGAPGTHEAYRLPVTRSVPWPALMLAGLTLAVVAAGATFGLMAAASFRRGQPDWLLTAFAATWIALGAGGLGYAARRLLRRATLGRTIVEISGLPLYPGSKYRVFVSQAGRLTLNRLSLRLVCEERATFRQGTNTRQHARKVQEQDLFVRQDVTIDPRSPLEVVCDLVVPDDVMHSFTAAHNEVCWYLLLEGQVDQHPPFRRRFPVVMHPIPEVSATR